MSLVFKLLLTTLVISSLSTSAAFAGKAKVIDWDTRLKPAYDWIERGDPDKAIVIFNKEISKNPGAGPPHIGLGLALKKKGKTGEAKAEFQRAIQIDPGGAEAYYEVASIQQLDKEYASAADNFEKYLQMAPTSSKKASVSERIKFCREQLSE